MSDALMLNAAIFSMPVMQTNTLKSKSNQKVSEGKHAGLLKREDGTDAVEVDVKGAFGEPRAAVEFETIYHPARGSFAHAVELNKKGPIVLLLASPLAVESV